IGFRESSKYEPRLIHEARTFGEVCTLRQSAANPDGAFIKMGQKLGTDDTAESEIQGRRKSRQPGPYSNVTMVDAPLQNNPVHPRQKLHHRVAQLRHSLAEEPAGENRSNQN